MFSKSCEYGLQAMIFIALHSRNNNKVTLGQIAKAEDIPQPFLSKILQQLVKHNLIGSRRGRYGGYHLIKSPKNISLLEIVKILDGTYPVENCVLGLNDCSDRNPCPVHIDFKKARDDIKQILKSKSLHSLTEDILSGSSKSLA